MCGLCGVAGNIGELDIRAFQELVYVSYLRGHDSTGIAAVPYLNGDGEQPEASVIKSPINAYEFLDRMAVKNILKTGHSVFLGHTRWRTFGEINRENAQPFEYPGIIGTHNGTLSGGAKWRLEGEEKGRNFDTDSAALYYSIDKIGIEKTLQMMDDHDAMALAWFDKDDNTLHLYRNDERPLWYVFDKAMSVFFWASDPAMLYLTLNRAKVAFNKVKELGVFSHLVLNLPVKPNQGLAKPFIEQLPMKKHIFPKIEVRQVINGQSAKSAEESGRIFAMAGGGYKEGTLPLVGGSPSTSGTASPLTLDQIKLKHDKRWKANTLFPASEEAGGPFYKTDGGRIYHEKEFDEKANEGCALNGEVPVFGEPVKFLRDESFICASCLDSAKSGKDQDTTELVLSMLE